MSDSAVLIYDGHCEFCRRQARRLRAWSGGRLQLQSFHDPGVLASHPELTRDACERAMQLVSPNGWVYPGAEAAAQALKFNPEIGWIGSLYYIPGVKQLADIAYRCMAANRYRFGGACADGSCAHR
jgi:predicted DCC family thiol-disulfide oxidoreductase YuxK